MRSLLIGRGRRRARGLQSLRTRPAGAGGSHAANASTAGELVVEPPTLINLGFEWFLEGDANRNAAVDVAYRKAGESAWRTGLPMLRMGGERIFSESRVDVVVPNMFGGQRPRPRARHRPTKCG